MSNWEFYLMVVGLPGEKRVLNARLTMSNWEFCLMVVGLLKETGLDLGGGGLYI